MPKRTIVDEIALAQWRDAIANQQTIDPRLLSEGTISQGSWLDFHPFIKSMYEGGKEMLGMSSSERLMKHLRDIKSPVLRPQTPFEWADKGAGIAAEGLQTGLAAADLAGLAGAVGPAAGRRLAQTMADETGTFGGGMAKNPPKDTSEWFTGMEGKRKFEIDDSTAVFHFDKLEEADKAGGGSLRLNELIDHNELFEQYPDLKMVRVRKAGDQNFSGSYLPPGNMDLGGTIFISDKSVNNQDTLVHEIQHAIQQKEEFARGGSPAYFEGRLNTINPRLSFLSKEMGRLPKTDPEWQAARNEYDQLISEKISWGSSDYYENYKNLAGEIEARDAANRRTWPMDLRRTMPPDLRKDAIIRMEGGGPAAQVGPFYHGTTKGFDEFDLNAPKTTLGGFSKYGVSVTPDPNVASRYAMDFGPEGGNVRPVVLDIEKTLQLKANEFEKLQSLVSKFDKTKKLSESDSVSLEILFKKHGIDFDESAHPIEQIKNAGFDSISKDAGKYGIAEAEVLVFDPKKIKSQFSRESGGQVESLHGSPKRGTKNAKKIPEFEFDPSADDGVEKFIEFIDAIPRKEGDFFGIGLRGIGPEEVGKKKLKRSINSIYNEDGTIGKEQLPGTSTIGITGDWDQANFTNIEKGLKEATKLMKRYDQGHGVVIVRGTPPRYEANDIGELLLDDAEVIGILKPYSRESGGKVEEIK